MVINGISAWEYYRTPPAIRDTDILEEQAVAPPPFGCGFPRKYLRLRSNASEASRIVQGRLLCDLKNVALPIRVFVDEGSSVEKTQLIDPARMPRFLPRQELVDLGAGLFITSPQLTLFQLARDFNWQHLALFMLEACGLFASTRYTLRAELVAKEVEKLYSSKASSLMRIPSVIEYCDESGNPIAQIDAYGRPLGWTPCVDRFGRITDLWKRPPLTTVEVLSSVIDESEGVRGLPVARRAASQVQNGSGSPLEARLLLLLCASARLGGEQWERPSLNRRISYDNQAQCLSGSGYCVCDFLWPEKKVLIEANGESYHSDRNGFRLESGRRAALESMGYSVFDISYSQISNLDQFEIMVDTFARNAGFSLFTRSEAFLRRRRALHKELFSPVFDRNASRM